MQIFYTSLLGANFRPHTYTLFGATTSVNISLIQSQTEGWRNHDKKKNRVREWGWGLKCHRYIGNSEEKQGTFRSKFLYQRRRVRFTCILNPTPSPRALLTSVLYLITYPKGRFDFSARTTPIRIKVDYYQLIFVIWTFKELFILVLYKKEKKKKNKWFVHELNISVISW